MHVVSEDGSPHGPKSFVLWNPPFVAPDRKGSGGKGLNMSHTEGRKRGGAKRSSTFLKPYSKENCGSCMAIRKMYEDMHL